MWWISCSVAGHGMWQRKCSDRTGKEVAIEDLYSGNRHTKTIHCCVSRKPMWTPELTCHKGNMYSIHLPHEIPELINKWSSFNSQHTLPKYFDVATIIMTLHLFARPLDVLRSIRKALNPSHGLLIVFEPGSREPILETLGQGSSDAYLVAAGTALCGPVHSLTGVRSRVAIKLTTRKQSVIFLAMKNIFPSLNKLDLQTLKSFLTECLYSLVKYGI